MPLIGFRQDENGFLIPIPMKPFGGGEHSAVKESVKKPKFFPEVQPLSGTISKVPIPPNPTNGTVHEVRKVLFKPNAAVQSTALKKNTKCTAQQKKITSPKVFSPVKPAKKLSSAKEQPTFKKPQLPTDEHVIDSKPQSSSEPTTEKDYPTPTSDNEFEGIEREIQEADDLKLRNVFDEMKLIALETETIFDEFEQRMKAMKQKMAQAFASAEELISGRGANKENKPPIRKVKTPAKKSQDLRKAAIIRSSAQTLASPRTAQAVDMYNSMREEYTILCTPCPNKSNGKTPKSLSRFLSNKVQTQCILLQDTPRKQE